MKLRRVASILRARPQVSEFDGLRKENVTLHEDNKKLRSELKGRMDSIEEV